MNKKFKIRNALAVSAITVLPLASIVACNQRNTKNNNNSVATDNGDASKNKDGSYYIKTMKTPKDSNYGAKNYLQKAATLSNNLNKNEYDTRIATGKVFAPHLHPRDIANWDKANETDGDYIRSKVPLAKTQISTESSLINSNKKDGRVYFMDPLRANTSNSVVGTAQKGSTRQQILDAMQYATDWVAFGGSVGEGTVYIPRSQDIDQLHRAGVRVHGTIFFAPGAYGGSPQQYNELLSKGPEVAAMQLVRVAKYFGFDGWMFNDENDIDASLLPQWKKMVLKLHELSKKEGLEVTYYSNSHRTSGREIASLGNKAVDVWFNDYGFQNPWGTSSTPNGQPKPKNPQDFLKEAQSPTGVEATAGMSRGINSTAGKSIWFYTAVKDGKAFEDERSRMKLFNGIDSKTKVINDPRQASDSALAHYYKEKTPFVDRKAFATSFNTGQGSKFFIDGKALEQKKIDDFLNKGYSNLALQDFQPTWRYIQDQTDGTNQQPNEDLTITQEMDSSDAWFGSSAMSYSGTVPANKTNINKLFASETSILKGDTFEIMYKGSVTPKLAVWSQSGKHQELIDGTISSLQFANGYHKVIYKLDALNGKTMSSFGVAFGDNTPLTVNVKVGQMKFVPKGFVAKTKTVVSSVKGQGQWLTSKGKNLRINLQTKDINKMYMVYKVIGSHKELINITNNSAFLVENLKFTSQITNLEIVPISNNLNQLEPIKISVSTTKLDLTQDSKWSHKILKNPGSYGVETMSGIVASISDGEGGAYILNDKITVMHYKKNGELLRSGNFGAKIFPGKNNGIDGEALAKVWLSSSKKLFISRRKDDNGDGKNELYVFDKQMNPVPAFDKFKKENSIFNDDKEYASNFFEQNNYIYVISNLGTIKRIALNGVLDANYSESVHNGQNYTKAGTHFKSNVGITILKKNDGAHKLIVQTQTRSYVKTTPFNPQSQQPEDKKNVTKIFSIDSSGNATSQNPVPAGLRSQILAQKELKDKIVMVTRLGVVLDFNKTTGKITKRIQLKFGHPTNRDPIDLTTLKANLVFSNDGEKLFALDENVQTYKQPWSNGYVEDVSRIAVFDLVDPTKESESYYVKNSTTKDIAGNTKKWGGHFRALVMLPNGRILYGTDDFGRIGLINYDPTQTDPKNVMILQQTGKITYYFTKNGKKLKMRTSFSLTGEDKFISQNPTK